ncbi:MAG TPA: MarR family winged helix-turn-helix transcriptional regulator, partial [Nakamurella sp.]
GKPTSPAAPGKSFDPPAGFSWSTNEFDRLVDRAVRAGMVARGTAAADSRHVTLTLTPGGSALLGRAFLFRTRYLEQVLKGWTRDDVATLARLLDRFADAVHTYSGAGGDR